MYFTAESLAKQIVKLYANDKLVKQLIKNGVAICKQYGDIRLNGREFSKQLLQRFSENRLKKPNVVARYIII